jgi:hypothetical protein
MAPTVARQEAPRPAPALQTWRQSISPLILDCSLSLRALAAKLTAEGLPTPAGAAVWTAACVARVKAKLAA